MGEGLRAALTIARRDLRSRLRDRSALVTAFAAPLVLAVILSVALAGPDEAFETTIALADEDGGALGEGLREALAGDELAEVVSVVEVADAGAARRALAEGTAKAGLVVPAGLGPALERGEGGRLLVLRHLDAGLSGDLAMAIAQGAATEVERGRAAVELAVEADALPPGGDEALVAAARGRPGALALVDDDVEGGLSGAASYFGPAMAVFFVFFVVGAGPQALLRQRRDGSLARLAAAPIPRGAIALGTAVSVGALAFLSIATLWLVMSLGFGARWGEPLGVIALAAGITVAAMSLTTLVATLARTEEQVAGWTSIVVFTLAL
ncbi:MAG: ABC transporter permease, partial [Egibacteraceae bacterium]